MRPLEQDLYARRQRGEGSPLPTSETSVFLNPDIAGAANLLGRYIHSTNSNDRRLVVDEALKPDQLSKRGIQIDMSVPNTILLSYTMDVLSHALELPEEERTQDNRKRISLYRGLITKLTGDDSIISPQKNRRAEERNNYDFTDHAEKVVAKGPGESLIKSVQQTRRTRESLQLPGVVGEFPKASLTIAEEALTEAFINQYGALIPKLSDNSILLSSSSEIMNYRNQTVDANLHSFVAAQRELLKQNFNVNETGLDEDKAWAMQYTPDGIPRIFYPMSYIEFYNSIEDYQPFSELREAASILYPAYDIIHENIHLGARLVEPFPIEPHGPLFQMAFEMEEFGVAENGQNRILRKQLEDRKSFAANNNPHITIEGTLVSLLCRDFDGEFRLIAESGYDLNEAITDRLSILPYEKMLIDIKSKYSPQTYEFIRDIITQNLSVGSYKVENVFSSLPGYLASLGINFKNTDELLNAYHHGVIPLLHAQRTPSRKYFT